MLTDASYSGDKTMQLISACYQEVVGIYRIKVEYGNFKNDYMGCWSQSFVGYYCDADEPYEDETYDYPSFVLCILLPIQTTMLLFL